MSAEIEIVMAKYDDVITVPTAACIELDSQCVCWVQQDSGPQRRTLDVGDSNNMFLLVRDGVAAGDRVILDPLANVPEAQVEAARSIGGAQDL